MDHPSTDAAANSTGQSGPLGQARTANAHAQDPLRGARKAVALLPALAALAYPFLLQGFHTALGSAGLSPQGVVSVWAMLWLIGALSVPLIGIACACRWGRVAQASQFELRACRLAFVSVAVPPLYVFVGVSLGLSGLPVKDVHAWVTAWLVAGSWIWISDTEAPTARVEYRPTLRVAHGIAAAFIALFVLFHLTNHLLGLLGPEVHALVMRFGRHAYRSRVLEPVLVILLLFQVASGAWLVRHWTAAASDRYRVLQIGSGVYLAAFVIAHLNSALVSARAIRGIETDWAWASGGASGLIYNAWNIRLVPHYAFGVFFVVMHLLLGLRQVLLSHGVSATLSNRLCIAGIAAGAVLASAVIYALCGGRIHWFY
jgi:hypothetical protein